jgi:hypothetical protein
MQTPELDPDVADVAPTGPTLSPRRRAFGDLLRLLDAEADGADWREVAVIVLHRDPNVNPSAPGEPSRAIFRKLYE